MTEPRPPSDETPAPPTARPTWELFVRVIDNRGDAGVGWRLARHLALREQRVRLWIDDERALQGMADETDRSLLSRGTIEVHAWPLDTAPFDLAPETVAVVEAFGCTLPEGVLAALGACATARPGPAPVWINLEYLSAEPYVERSHRLPSPRNSGPAAGCVTWFFYPGFTDRTGGLLLQADPGVHPQAPPREPVRPGEAEPKAPLRVSRFDYGPPGAPAWLAHWAESIARESPGTRLLCLEPGALDSAQARRPPDEAPGSPSLQRMAVPWLTQSGYDSLLASCDLNIVRGEDSFVRAQWAGRPLIWQAYPQHDGAHAIKLDAWLDAYLEGCDRSLASIVREVHWLWNGLDRGLARATIGLEALDRKALGRWAEHARRWRDALGARPDLASALIAFVAGRRPSGLTTGT